MGLGFSFFSADSAGAPGSIFYLGLGFAFSWFVIPTGAARFSFTRRTVARRAA